MAHLEFVVLGPPVSYQTSDRTKLKAWQAIIKAIQVSIDDPIRIRRASKILLDAFCAGDEFIYVRIEDAPEVIQLPR